VRILITENTVESVRPAMERGSFGHFELTPLASVKVKGKEKEVKIFELKGLKKE
jgi:hypothetical protein